MNHVLLIYILDVIKAVQEAHANNTEQPRKEAEENKWLERLEKEQHEEEKQINIFRAGTSRKKERYVRKESRWIEERWSKAWKGIWYYYEDAKKCTGSNGWSCCKQWYGGNTCVLWVVWSGNQEVGSNLEASGAAK